MSANLRSRLLPIRGQEWMSTAGKSVDQRKSGSLLHFCYRYLLSGESRVNRPDHYPSRPHCGCRSGEQVPGGKANVRTPDVHAADCTGDGASSWTDRVFTRQPVHRAICRRRRTDIGVGDCATFGVPPLTSKRTIRNRDEEGWSGVGGT